MWLRERPAAGKVKVSSAHRPDAVPHLDLASPAPDSADEPRRPVVPSVDSLYREHARTVARWAMRLLGPRGDYEDVVHEVFLVVGRRLPEFRGDAAVTTWLYEITVRVVQRMRSKGRWWAWVTGRGKSPSRSQEGDIWVAPPDSPRDPPRDPQALLESRERTELLYRLLDELSEEQRTLLILFELEELSGRQIADIIGVNVGTVWVRLSRARHKFVERMRAWEAREEA